MLHVVNGDATAEAIREAGVGGEVAVWAEPLHEGPIPLRAEPEHWRQVRAHYYAGRGYGSVGDALTLLAAWDEALGRWPGHDEVVLWFESDLFDQLLLIRHLERFHGRDLGPTRLSLAPAPETEAGGFVGLGALAPDQVGATLAARREVDDRQLALGRVAWWLYGLPDPTGLRDLLGLDTSALPWLAPALRRHFEEFPSTRDGLSRTESESLRALADGPRPFAEVFVAAQAAESRPFRGDSTVRADLERLARAAHSLVAWPSPEAPLSLTAHGRRVLDGRADAVALNGIDRWLGGVHLHGSEAQWRWDPDAGHLTPAHRPL